MFEAIALLTVMLTTFGVIGVSAQMQRKRRQAWVDAGQIFGLHGDTERLVGRVDGQHVTVENTTRVRPGFEVQIPITLIELRLSPALDLGVGMERINTQGKRLDHVADLDVGDVRLDEAYVFNAYEHKRLRGLLKRQQLRDLMADVGDEAILNITDRAITIECEGRASKAWICENLDRGLEMVRHVDKRRDKIPLSPALGEVEAVWRDLAKELKAKLRRTPLRMTAVVEGMRVTVRAERKSRHRYMTRVVFRFERPIPHKMRQSARVKRALARLPHSIIVSLSDQRLTCRASVDVGALFEHAQAAARACAIAAGHLEEPKSPYR